MNRTVTDPDFVGCRNQLPVGMLSRHSSMDRTSDYGSENKSSSLFGEIRG